MAEGTNAVNGLSALAFVTTWVLDHDVDNDLVSVCTLFETGSHRAFSWRNRPMESDLASGIVLTGRTLGAASPRLLTVIPVGGYKISPLSISYRNTHIYR
jgi:hypothetical protein